MAAGPPGDVARWNSGSGEPYTSAMSNLAYDIAVLEDGQLGTVAEAVDRGPLLELAFETIEASSLPQPYRDLLAHRNDMTSTLERFHDEPITLRPLTWKLYDGKLYRRVVLVGMRSARPVEYGAIRIDLRRFDPLPKSAILAGRQPLGAILADHAIRYRSRPRRFFRLRSIPEVSAALELPVVGADLYGRENVLENKAGERLAEVMEILAPLGEGAAPRDAASRNAASRHEDAG